MPIIREMKYDLSNLDKPKIRHRWWWWSWFRIRRFIKKAQRVEGTPPELEVFVKWERTDG